MLKCNYRSSQEDAIRSAFKHTFAIRTSDKALKLRTRTFIKNISSRHRCAPISHANEEKKVIEMQREIKGRKASNNFLLFNTSILSAFAISLFPFI